MNRNTIKLLSIVAYLCIILKGSMIGLPFCLWLIFALFDFGAIDQLFALIAIVGLVVIIRKRNTNQVLPDLLCFLALCVPIISRLVSVPLELFNYWAFIIPSLVFVIFYLTSLILIMSEKASD